MKKNNNNLIDPLINIEKYLFKHNFNVEHFIHSDDWEEHLTIYDNEDNDIYKISMNDEKILLQAYCSTLNKTFDTAEELRDFITKDIRQYL